MAKGIKYYSMREAKKAGKIAGRNWEWKPWRPLPSGWPLWESKQPDPPITQKEHSQYEATLISIAHENLEQICKKLSEEDEKLTQEYCSAKTDYERLKSKMDDETEEHKEAILSYEKAKTAFFNFSPRWVPIWLYWFIFIAISCGEGVFNFKVFQIFGADTRETIAMAGAVIISIPVFSEILGHYLKKEEKLSMDKLYIGLSVVIVVALLVFLAILRETFFKASPDIQIPMSPTKLAMILVVFNLTFFIALSFLSYAEARKNPEEYRKAKKAYEGALKDVKERGGDVEKVAEELAKADERLNKACSARQHTFEEYEHTAKAEQDGWVGYIRTYRHANMSVRKDKTLPESFKVDPEESITIPDALKKLDWECREEKEKEKK